MGVKKILWVEDDAIIRDLAGSWMDLLNYPLETAENGIEALEKMAREDFALVITDLHMPKMDGYSMIQKIRKIYGRKKPYIIIVSGSKESLEAVNGFGLADALLTKPVSFQDLKKIISSAME